MQNGCSKMKNPDAKAPKGRNLQHHRTTPHHSILSSWPLAMVICHGQGVEYEECMDGACDPIPPFLGQELLEALRTTQ